MHECVYHCLSKDTDGYDWSFAALPREALFYNESLRQIIRDCGENAAEALQKAGAHRTQQSLWLVRSERSAKALVEEYKGYLDGDDRVWVTKVPKGAYWYSNAIGGTNNWIAKYPPN